MSHRSHIYSAQLTARGGSSGNLTARGANHFLGKSGGTSTSAPFPSLLKSSRRRRNSLKSSASLDTNLRPLNSSRRPRNSTAQFVRKNPKGTLPYLPSNNPAANSLSIDETTKINRSLNKKIVQAMEKSRRGIGFKLLAPTKSTKEEQAQERVQLTLLRAKLRAEMFQVDTDLIAEKLEMNKKNAMLAQYNALTTQLNTMEQEHHNQQKQLDRVSAARQDEDKDKDARVESVLAHPDVYNAVQEFNTTAPDSSLSLSLSPSPRKSNIVKFNHQLASTFENVQQCSLGDSYAEDVLLRNSDAYDGQQTIASGPHAMFTAPSNERATVVAGRYYPPGQNPLESEDGGIFWPFEEERTKKSPPKASRRVAPRAAHVSAKVQGGFGSVLIDVDPHFNPDGSVKKKHQQPSRWSALDPSTDVISMERAGVIKNTGRGTTKKEWAPKVGAKCNARYKGDKEWYLATILDVQTNGLKVKFESRGNNKIRTVLPGNVRPVVWNRPLTAQWSRN